MVRCSVYSVGTPLEQTVRSWSGGRKQQWGPMGMASGDGDGGCGLMVDVAVVPGSGPPLPHGPDPPGPMWNRLLLFLFSISTRREEVSDDRRMELMTFLLGSLQANRR